MRQLDLPDWNTLAAQEDDSDCFITAEYTVHATNCPKCGFILLDRHGKINGFYRDTPVDGKHRGIEVRRQRYKCQNCGKTFVQDLPDLDENHTMTKRLIAYIQRRSFSTTFLALSRDVGSDEKTIRNIFGEHVKELEKGRIVVAPTWLGIDELKLVGGYRAVLCDIKEQRILDMLKNRSKVHLSKWLSTLKGRDKVEIVTMDMWQTYRDLVQVLIPQAQIVVDKFHFVRMATDGVETVRKEIRAGLSDQKRRQLMHDRSILLRRKEDLAADQLLILDTWLSNLPLLRAAYEHKERLFDIWDMDRKADVEKEFGVWVNSIPDEIVPAFQPLLTAVSNWHDEIFAYFDYRATNAFTESLNGTIKLANRNGRGYSFEVIRARTLFSPNHMGKKNSVDMRDKFATYTRPASEVHYRRRGGEPQKPVDPNEFHGMPLSTLNQWLKHDEFLPQSTLKSE